MINDGVNKYKLVAPIEAFNILIVKWDIRKRSKLLRATHSVLKQAKTYEIIINYKLQLIEFHPIRYNLYKKWNE